MLLKEIIPNIWISNKLEFSNGISNLFALNNYVNCDFDLRNLNKSKNYNFEIKKRIFKYEVLKISEYLFETTKYIHKNIKCNKSTIIYSTDINKSIMLILAYLILYGKIDLSCAIQIVKTKIDNEFNLNDKYKMSLETFEKQYKFFS